MADNKKLITAGVAVVTSAALLFGGTYAWQSISQTALNEASDVINPGGRLHDDFYIDASGNYNADIYVENFADDEIFARVRLEEYMEVVINYGTDAAITQTLVGSQGDVDSDNPNVVYDKDGNALYERDYTLYDFTGNEVTDADGTATGDFSAAIDGDTASWFTWTPGSANSETVYYMPTFNMNKDSLVADRNGMYVDRIGGISNRSVDQYEDYTVYIAGQEEPGTEIYDVDGNWVDEVGYDFENLPPHVEAGNIKTVEATHTAAPVGTTNGLISMSEWIDKLDNGEDTSRYWVYDTDGWVYWSSPIEAKSTTGLLLDSIELNQVMDDTWYYAINVIGQFCTAGDVDGFYNDGEAPSSDAETLLEEIGAGTGEAAEDDEPEIIDQPLDVYVSYAADGTIAGSQPIDPETGEPAEGVIQIFAIGIEEKPMYLGGKLTREDGSVLDSRDANSGLTVSYTFEAYHAYMAYTHVYSDDTEHSETFTISTIDDETSRYYGYKVATCDDTGEQMVVLNEETGHLIMLAKDQPINQTLTVKATTTYNDTTYESNSQQIFFVNRDINLFLDGEPASEEGYYGYYTPGEGTTFTMTAKLLFENESDTSRTITWSILGEDNSEINDGTVTVSPGSASSYTATVVVSESATGDYTVLATYDHTVDDGKNKGLYQTGWGIRSTGFGGEEYLDLDYERRPIGSDLFFNGESYHFYVTNSDNVTWSVMEGEEYATWNDDTDLLEIDYNAPANTSIILEATCNDTGKYAQYWLSVTRIETLSLATGDTPETYMRFLPEDLTDSNGVVILGEHVTLSEKGYWLYLEETENVMWTVGDSSLGEGQTYFNTETSCLVIGEGEQGNNKQITLTVTHNEDATLTNTYTLQLPD